ncbi:hypothetical protein [Vandammella animalimorsus]|uniref:phage major capsid protein n=1 Tax=Vandammella animalimorsus TaxID=2029117 RepID=UPI001EEE88BB|nr:hypothetical protein [Vandammella animalimorsus]
MNLAQLIQFLAARGGLQTPDEVQACLREAAPAPERDFRQLIELVSGAVRQRINEGRPEGDKRWADICGMYADRIVVQIDGRKWQYGYTLVDDANGGQAVQLAAPVEVVERFVPVREGQAQPDSGALATFREAADGSIAVTLIRAGRSGNNNYYPDAALREAAPLFEGARVFAKSDADHIKGGGKDVRNLIGGVYGVQFVEGQGPDTGALTGTFRPISPSDPVVQKMVEAVQRGMQHLLGLSIDAMANIRPRREGRTVLREAVRFSRVNSVDLIVEPGAGGGLDRLTEAAADQPTDQEKAMPLWKQRMLEAIQKTAPAQYAAINPETIGDDELVNLHEAVCGPLVPGATGAGSDALREAQGDDAPVTRAELQMLQLRQTAGQRIAASTLPAPAKQRLQTQFERAERFTEAEIDQAIKAEGEYLARFTESGSVRVPVFGGGSIEVGDRSVQVREMLDAFFNPAHKNHGAVSSLREAYIEITGDKRVTGRMEHCDMGRMAESLGVMREAIDSGTFASALGDSITRRMQEIYTGETDLDVWRKVATVGSVSDFRTQERIQIGGYGNLPAVAEKGEYTALSSPSDAKATYKVSKRGGTETVTLETIKNDDVNTVRRIPLELALAAKNTLYEFVFDFFKENGNIYDGKALYHSDHGNLFTAALSADEFAKHRLAMLKQTRSGSGKRLAAAPRTLLIPFELQELAYNLFVRQQNLDKTFVQTINPEIIPVSYWTDDKDWVTVADTNRLPVLEVSFLDGRQEPELFVQDMPNVGSLFANDTITYKIRHIYGGAVLVDGCKGTTKAVVA